MNIGNNSNYQDLSKFQSYQNANKGGMSSGTDSNNSVPNGGIIYMMIGDENTLLSTGGGEYAKLIEYASHSTEENPVVNVIHKYADGTKESYSIFLHDIDPTNATVTEIQALLTHLNDGEPAYLPHNFSSEGKQNFLALYQSDMNRLNSVGYATPEMSQAYQTLVNFMGTQTSGTTGNLANNRSAFGLPVSTETDSLKEQLATLISGYDRAALEEVQEKEKEASDWNELLKAIDRHIEVTAEGIEEEAQEKLDQWIENELLKRELLWKIDPEEAELPTEAFLV